MGQAVKRRRRALAWVAAVMLGTVGLSPLAPSSSANDGVLGGLLGDECGARVAKQGGGTWSCTFVDQFSGRTLDPDKWVVQDTARTGFHVSGTCMEPDNVDQRGGRLELTVHKQAPFLCESPSGGFRTQYSGADISTWASFAQAYGRFEARIKFPGGRGFFEDTGWNCEVERRDQFHTYALEWTPKQMRFIYDGQVCYTRSWSPEAPLRAPAPFDQPFFISLTQGTGPNAFNAPEPGAEFPATMTVDYVKAWS